MGQQHALHNRVNQLATDIGRLRHRTRALDDLANRLADDIEAIVLMLEPTAAQIAATTAPGNPAAISEAIRLVDQRHHQLRNQLGGPNGH